MFRLLTIAVLLLGLVICGCAKKIDASSDQALKDSTEQISKTLDDSKKQKFQDSLAMIMADAGLKVGLVDPETAQKKIRDRLNGKTADEVIAEGEKLKSRMMKTMGQ